MNARPLPFFRVAAIAAFLIALAAENKIQRKFQVGENEDITSSLEKNPIPIFNVHNNELLSVRYNNASGKKIKVTIQQDNEIIFEDSNILDKIVFKKYSLKALKTGVYDVKMQIEDKVFNYSFALN